MGLVCKIGNLKLPMSDMWVDEDTFADANIRELVEDDIDAFIKDIKLLDNCEFIWEFVREDLILQDYAVNLGYTILKHANCSLDSSLSFAKGYKRIWRCLRPDPTWACAVLDDRNIHKEHRYYKSLKDALDTEE